MSQTSKEPARATAKKVSNRRFKVHRVEVEPSDNGGYVARHFFKEENPRRNEPGQYREPETLIHKTLDEVKAGMSKAFGEKGKPADAGAESDESEPEDA